MFHEMVDSERQQLIDAIKETGYAFILWHGNVVRVRRKKMVEMIRGNKYAAYGSNTGTGEYTFYTLTNEDEE